MNKILFALIAASFSISQMYGQCETWVGADNRAELEGHHTVYKSNLESKDYDVAFEYWKKVYKAAPAADGKRASHYLDGATLYKEKYKATEDPAQKEEYLVMVNKLFDQAIECYKSGVISIKGCKEQKCLDEMIGYIEGRRAYMLYYELNADREQVFQSLKASLEMGGHKSEYFTIGAFGELLAEQVKNETIDYEKARELHTLALDVAEINIANNPDYAKYYSQGRMQLQRNMSSVEGMLYDCDYFKEKLIPEYRENSDNGPNIKRIYTKLSKQGCDPNDPIMLEMKGKYDKYRAEEKERELQELAKSDPAVAAQLAYNDGDYEGAASKYEEAISKVSDPAKLADLHFRLASIQGRRLSQYANSRRNALKAVELKSNWGRPYMLIGDLYGSSSRNCGDSWNQRLAVLAAIDKYAKAKSVDPSLADEANKRISAYSRSKPLKDEAFMQGYKEGQSLKVGCWIGETVSLRF